MVEQFVNPLSSRGSPVLSAGGSLKLERAQIHLFVAIRLFPFLFSGVLRDGISSFSPGIGSVSPGFYAQAKGVIFYLTNITNVIILYPELRKHTVCTPRESVCF